jgi:uncharacterized sulfatase
MKVEFGQLVESLLTQNTLVVYLADNGWNAAQGYEGGRAKLSPYEVGIRTPIFARWPARMPASRDDETLASIIDVAPTILAAAGVRPPAPIPGINLLDPAAARARETLFVEAYTHDVADIKDPAKSLMAAVVISGHHKLIIPATAAPDRPFATVPAIPELYDLKADPFEKTNLAQARPEVVERLKALQNLFWNFN